MKRNKFRHALILSIVTCNIPVIMASSLNSEIKLESTLITQNGVGAESVKGGTSVVLKNTETGLESKQDGGSEKILAESEITTILNKFMSSLEEDLNASYTELVENNLSSDHLKLATWGEFLYFYGDKTVSSMPNKDFTLTLQDGSKWTISGDRVTRAWVSETLIPKLKEVLLNVSNAHMVSVYKYIPKETIYLSDFNYEDLKSDSATELQYVVHPFTGAVAETDGVEAKQGFSLDVHSIGANYGIQLNTLYTQVVGNLDNETGVYVSLEKRKDATTDINCVSKVVALSIPRTVDEESIMTPQMEDYTNIVNLALDLSNKKVVNIISIDGAKIELVGDLATFSLSEDSVAIKKLEDGGVAVPLLFDEYFQTSSAKYPNGFVVDLSPIVFQGVSEVKVGERFTDTLERYIGVNGGIDVGLDEANRLYILNGLGKTNYERMAIWIWSGKADAYLSDIYKDKFIESAEKWYTQNNRLGEWKSIKKENGVKEELSTGMQVAIAIGVVIVVIGLCVGVVKFVKHSKAVNNKDEANLPFDFDDDIEE